MAGTWAALPADCHVEEQEVRPLGHLMTKEFRFKNFDAGKFTTRML